LENTELIPIQQLICSQKLIKINAKQSYLKALHQGIQQLKQLKRELNQSFQQRGKICQTHTEFFHVDNPGEGFFYQATCQQQKIFYPPDYRAKFQEF